MSISFLNSEKFKSCDNVSDAQGRYLSFLANKRSNNRDRKVVTRLKVMDWDYVTSAREKVSKRTRSNEVVNSSLDNLYTIIEDDTCDGNSIVNVQEYSSTESLCITEEGRSKDYHENFGLLERKINSLERINELISTYNGYITTKSDSALYSKIQDARTCIERFHKSKRYFDAKRASDITFPKFYELKHFSFDDIPLRYQKFKHSYINKIYDEECVDGISRFSYWQDLVEGKNLFLITYLK